MSSTLLLNPTALDAGRRAAFDRFSAQGFPHRRIEGWKWSDFQRVLRNAPEDAARAAAALNDAANDPANDAASVIGPSPFAFEGISEIQIVNGRVETPAGAPALNDAVSAAAPGGFMTDIGDHPIATLNEAMAGAIMKVTVTPAQNWTGPLLLRHINTAAEPVFSRIEITVADGAHFDLIETFEGAAVFSSSITEVNVERGGVFRRFAADFSRAASVHHALASIRAFEGAHVSQASISTGGRLSRHEAHITCEGAGVTIDLSSAALLRDKAHADFTSLIRYKAPQCVTRQTHKGVVNDAAQSVFQGKFLVERAAQKTDADMQANALLLSDHGEANHKPELEIYADDVECAHGSTAGALNEEALFYMRQRGIDEVSARNLLIRAFVGEAFDAIENTVIRDVFSDIVDRWLRGAAS